MVFNSSNRHSGYVFPCLAGSQLSPQAIHVSSNSPGEGQFSCQVCFPIAKAKHGNASIVSCHHSPVSCLPCDADKDKIWHLRWLAFFQTPAHGIITPSSINFFLHPPVCGVFFFLIHVQQVPSIPQHVPRSFPMSAVKLKGDFLNLIDQVVTNLARSQICWTLIRFLLQNPAAEFPACF